MFKEPFSFVGRIRRTEFAIGVLLRYIAILAIGFFIYASSSDHGISGVLFLLFILLIPFTWFSLAQNTKRCHDRGNSGWFQLIPLYGLVLLFGPGDIGDNRFGPDPKESEDNY